MSPSIPAQPVLSAAPVQLVTLAGVTVHPFPTAPGFERSKSSQNTMSAAPVQTDCKRVYDCPVKLPFPAPAPPSGTAPDTMLSLSTRLSPKEPLLPVPVFAFTVQVVPLPVTEVIAAPTTPPACSSAKSDASTPVTLRSNVTVQETVLFAAVGSKLARLMEATDGYRTTVTALLNVYVALAPVLQFVLL